MEREIKVIWQTAINLGFKFKECDAQYIWNEINKFQIKEKSREVQDYYNKIKNK